MPLPELELWAALMAEAADSGAGRSAGAATAIASTCSDGREALARLRSYAAASELLGAGGSSGAAKDGTPWPLHFRRISHSGWSGEFVTLVSEAPAGFAGFQPYPAQAAYAGEVEAGTLLRVVAPLRF